MNHQAQSMVMAEIHGFKYLGEMAYGGKTAERRGWWKNDDYFPFGPPEYLIDLNAIRDVEKVLIAKGGLDTYEHFLRENEQKEDGKSWFGSVHASAEQRVEAIIKTFGKWELDTEAN